MFALHLRPSLLAIAAVAALGTSAVHAEAIVRAAYAEPVDRYGHFALGAPHEYARLEATTDTGRTLVLELPGNEVFEDLVPRPVSLSDAAAPELLAIVSGKREGACLALIGLKDGRLQIVARSEPIGIPNRWLNPVGVADLDGDGVAEIAAVITPHIGGILRVYRRAGSRLVEIASMNEFSNHAYGSPELGLSLPVRIGDRTQLVVPDTMRRSLRIVALESGRLVETGRCALADSVVGPIQQTAPGQVSVTTSAGDETVALADCLK